LTSFQDDAFAPDNQVNYYDVVKQLAAVNVVSLSACCKICCQYEDVINVGRFVSPRRWPPLVKPPEEDFAGVVVYVDLSLKFYLQTAEQAERVRRMTRQADERFSGQEAPARPQNTAWFKGQPCMAIFHFDRSWYRAEVTRTPQDGSDLHEVTLIDWGNVLNVSAKHMRKDVLERDLPPQCIVVADDGVRPVADARLRESEAVKLHAKMVNQAVRVTRDASGRTEIWSEAFSCDVASVLTGLRFPL